VKKERKKEYHLRWKESEGKTINGNKGRREKEKLY
jgi:hypothetical protein